MLLLGYCLWSLLTLALCRDLRLDDENLHQVVDEKQVVDASTSESYVIQGDEEVSEEDVDNAEKEAKEEALVQLQEMFGLAEPVARNHHQVPPQFMTELYKTIADPSGVTRGRNPFDATVVRSFIERDNTRPHFFSFNISGLDASEKILEAELHLYRLRDPKQTPSLTTPYYLIRVFQVVNESRLSTPDIHRLLSVHYLSAHETGWQVFNVKAAVLAWVTGASPNHGLLVTTTTVFGDHVDVRFARRNEHHNSKQPILVLFDDDATKLNEAEATPKPNPLANYPSQYRYQVDDTLNEIEEDADLTRQRRSVSGAKARPRNATAPKDSDCARYELPVDFDQIGWRMWIIAPKGYSAFQCLGQCNFPLGQGQRPTNHATVQSIVHVMNPDEHVGQPCCVPTSLLPLSVLYFDDSENVVLKNYEDMVAESCGCH